MIWFEGWKAPLILTQGVFHLSLSVGIIFFEKPALILTFTPSGLIISWEKAATVPVAPFSQRDNDFA